MAGINPYQPGVVDKPGDLFSFLTKLGGDMGFSLRDLPALISKVGETAREVKELNREMPIMPVIAAIQEIIKQKEDISEVVDLLKGGLPNAGTGKKLESSDSGNPGNRQDNTG